MHINIIYNSSILSRIRLALCYSEKRFPPSAMGRQRRDWIAG